MRGRGALAVAGKFTSFYTEMPEVLALIIACAWSLTRFPQAARGPLHHAGAMVRIAGVHPEPPGQDGLDMKAFEIGGIALEPARMGIPLLACEGDIIVSPPLPERAARAHLALARELYSARRRRARFFPAALFGEAAWDILLDLYIARHERLHWCLCSADHGAALAAPSDGA